MAELTLSAGMMAAPNIRLEKKLREGGMGSVWIAEHLSLKTRVAVKFMLLEQSKSKEATTRFSREASAAAQIKSPHVVQVFDHGVNEDGLAFIVMELLEGEDLGTRLARKGALPLAEVATIIAQAAKALSKAHASGIVHRDIKPDNIFLMDVDGELFVKVLDFGVAKNSHEQSMTMTSTGMMMGTPYYMSPEQMANAKNAVPQSDMWSLAVVAYEAMAAHLPFEGETVAGLAIAVERGKYKAATEHVPTAPKALDAWFAKAFAREPADRFASARQMGEEITHIVHPGIRGSMPSDLTASYADAPVVAVDMSRARLPTQMGATLDGVPRQGKRRGLALAIGAIGVLGAAVIVAFLVLKDGAAKTSSPVAGEPQTSQTSETKAGGAPPPTVLVTPASTPAISAAPEPSESAAPLASTPSASAQPSATSSASAPPTTIRTNPKPTTTWSNPTPTGTKNRGF